MNFNLNDFAPSAHFHAQGIEIMRLTKDGIWVNPDVPVEDAVAKMLTCLDANIKALLSKARRDALEEAATRAEKNGHSLVDGAVIAEAIRRLDEEAKEQEGKNG